MSFRFVIERKTRSWNYTVGYYYNIVTRRNLEFRNHALLIDFDNTLVEFNKQDRTIQMPFRVSSQGCKSILDILKNKFSSSGIKHLIIITNQKKMAGPLCDGLRVKLENAAKQIEKETGFYVSIIACADPTTLKPACWHALKTLPFTYHGMVGDAGGEPGDYGRQDIDLASMLSIPFYHVDKLLK